MVQNIKRLCAAQGISIRQLEIALGYVNGIIGRWDINRPSVDRVKAVADYLGVTVDELLREEVENDA